MAARDLVYDDEPAAGPEYVVPDDLKGLRACLCCGLIKTVDQVPVAISCFCVAFSFI